MDVGAGLDAGLILRVRMGNLHQPWIDLVGSQAKRNAQVIDRVHQVCWSLALRQGVQVKGEPDESKCQDQEREFKAMITNHRSRYLMNRGHAHENHELRGIKYIKRMNLLADLAKNPIRMLGPKSSITP